MCELRLTNYVAAFQRDILIVVLWIGATAQLGGCQPDFRIRTERDLNAGAVEGRVLRIYEFTKHLPKDTAELRHAMGHRKGEVPEIDLWLDHLTIHRYVGDKEVPDCPNPTRLRFDGVPYDEERYRWLDLAAEFGRPSARDRTGEYLASIVSGDDFPRPLEGYVDGIEMRHIYPRYGWRFPSNEQEIEEFKVWLKELFYPSNALLDGWDRELRFRVTGPKNALMFEVRSAGEDGKFDTKDDLVQRHKVVKPVKGKKTGSTPPTIR